MNLRLRKYIIIGLILGVFLAGNITIIANWLIDSKIEQKAVWFREHFLTGTAVTIIAVLLFLTVNHSKSIIYSKANCPVCGKHLASDSNYCPACGSKV